MVPSLGALHETVATEALQAGLHVLLEKPMSNSVLSATRILEAVPEGSVLLCAENSQYWHEVVVAREKIQQGCIGEVLNVRAKFWESAHPMLNEWAASGSYDPGAYVCEGSEGFVFDGGLHWLRPLRMLVGEVSHVVATCGATLRHMRGPGMTNALLRFSSGASGMFESILAPGAVSDQPFFVVQGTQGEIVIDGFQGGARMYTVDPSGGLCCTDLNQGLDPSQVGWNTGYVGEMEDFAAAVLDGKKLEASAAEAREDLRLMLAMMLSAKRGVWVGVAEVEGELSMGGLGMDFQHSATTLPELQMPTTAP
eukprot:TRINITY_DN39816_c0_g1_i1.p1 TRINITY_DN39816_c0_g1~~TRINITY_DN39816_c0_g1_i1.p1  ORF type:complete len:310 (+),score=75.79 TRINITY_DN39816_c0_g1_i1:258-1187(+)